MNANEHQEGKRGRRKKEKEGCRFAAHSFSPTCLGDPRGFGIVSRYRPRYPRALCLPGSSTRINTIRTTPRLIGRAAVAAHIPPPLSNSVLSVSSSSYVLVPSHCIAFCDKSRLLLLRRRHRPKMINTQDTTSRKIGRKRKKKERERKRE